MDHSLTLWGGRVSTKVAYFPLLMRGVVLLPAHTFASILHLLWLQPVVPNRNPWTTSLTPTNLNGDREQYQGWMPALSGSAHPLHDSLCNHALVTIEKTTSPLYSTALQVYMSSHLTKLCLLECVLNWCKRCNQWLQWLQWGVTFSQVVWLIGCWQVSASHK